MKVIIGFSKPKNKIFPWFSWLIRLYEGTEYSHVYIRWEISGLSESICYQASGLQVNFIGQKMFNYEIQPVAEYQTVKELSEEGKKALLKFCVSNAGVPYGVGQILGMLLQKLFKLKKNPLGDTSKHLVCSELVGIILRDIFYIQKNVEQDDLLPKDIEDLVKSSPLFCKIK